MGHDGDIFNVRNMAGQAFSSRVAGYMEWFVTHRRGGSEEAINESNGNDDSEDSHRLVEINLPCKLPFLF